MERSIIHLNVADFAVAVERVVDCRLQDRPVIIAPEGAARAVGIGCGGPGGRGHLGLSDDAIRDHASHLATNS
jgi:hypothetical protein